MPLILQTEYQIYTINIARLTLTEDCFEKDEGITRFYTGLNNFSLLMTVFNFVCDFVTHSPHSKLSKWQAFILVMMRLRLSMSIEDIGYRFAISTSCVAHFSKMD